jgi:hypothetical protein
MRINLRDVDVVFIALLILLVAILIRVSHCHSTGVT